MKNLILILTHFRLCLNRVEIKNSGIKLTWENYPVKAKLKEIQSTLKLLVVCSWEGEAKEIKVMSQSTTEGADGLDFLQAAKKILKGIKLIPASKNDVFVNSGMEITFRFKMNKSSSRYDRKNKDGEYIQYYDKYFYVSEIDNIELPVEKGFEIENAVRIKYASEEHFEFMYQHPDLIKYCLDFSSIALIVNGQYYLVLDNYN